MSNVLSESQLGLFPEGAHQCGAALRSAERSSGLHGKVLPVLRAEVGQRMPFEVAPDVFGGIEFGCIGRQSCHAQTISNGGDKVSYQTTAVGGQTIPDHQQFSANLTEQAAEEVDHLRRPDGATVQTEVELPPRDTGDHGPFSPVEVKGQLRRLASGCPRPSNRRAFAQAAFVHKHYGSAFFSGLFFNAGQVYRFQWAMAASSRSWALPLGRWQLQFNRASTRHRCAG